MGTRAPGGETGVPAGAEAPAGLSSRGVGALGRLLRAPPFFLELLLRFLARGLESAAELAASAEEASAAVALAVVAEAALALTLSL